MKDLPPETHAELDALVANASKVDVVFAELILFYVIMNPKCIEKYADVWPINLSISFNDLASRPDIEALLRVAHATGRYAPIRRLPEFHMKEKASNQQVQAGKREFDFDVLRDAYNKKFRGKVADDFINYLVKTDEDVQQNRKYIYAKAVPIIQSSGTGKSRMLTEAGKMIFTLPICLRAPGAPGYPPGDKAVYDYFASLDHNNDLSVSAHAAIACFLGAAHTTMLNYLRNAQAGRTPMELLGYWHSVMEESEGHADFFEGVVNLAKSLRRMPLPPTMESVSSAERDENGDPNLPDFKIERYAMEYYKEYTKKATNALTAFASSLTPQKPVVVTYFDEAHELKLSYWMLLRLLNNQDREIPMWAVFMSTHSSITYSNPAPRDVPSLRLRQELERLLEPYIALGFDQNVICENRPLVTVTMGYLQSVEHLSRYGRPMWNAQFREGEEGSLVEIASIKLINGKFNPKDMNQVLAILSQRVCVDTVLVGSEALQLADRSVANHMRLMTGISHNQRIFQTHSPSEPILALGAARFLYNKNNTALGQVLNTFSDQLCEAGLVEKGLLGEFAGRILLTIARDLAAPKKSIGFGPDLLRPVLLMDFLDKLFGNKSWCGCRLDFNQAFDDTYVNFTHWIVTKDPLPEKPSRQLLGNLWARGGALQCYSQQESLDLLIVTYKGSIAASAIFDVENLSAAVVQIKYKVNADTEAGRGLRPMGMPRNVHRPLPYIALLMELGNESNHQGGTKSNPQIKVTASPLKDEDGDGFESLWKERESAVKILHEYRANKEKEKTKTRKGGRSRDARETELEKKVEDAHAKIDAVNRFSICVRGASPKVYGVLREANIVREFEHLLEVTMPLPITQDTTMKYMRPLERLDEASDHTAWMSLYGRGEDGGDGEGESSMDVDFSPSLNPTMTLSL